MGLTAHALVVATSLVNSTAIACSCTVPPHSETEQQAFERAWQATPIIVEADFVSATITLEKGEPIEDGVLRVRSSFKGHFKTGDLIRTRSNISGAACGWSLRGTPPAAMEIGNKETRRLEPYWQWGGYDRWVLFLSGPAPYEVSTCSRSLPGGLSQDLPWLTKRKLGPSPDANMRAGRDLCAGGTHCPSPEPQTHRQRGPAKDRPGARPE